MRRCPRCQQTLLPVSGEPGRFSCASGCEILAESGPSRLEQLHAGRDQELALKLPHLDPGRQSVKVKQGEKEVQRAIVEALKARGYIVQETSEARRRVQCPPQLTAAERSRGERPGCGKWFYPIGGRSGLSRGLSDLLVRNPCWPRWLWCAIEVKGGNSASREEQIKLAQDGHTRIVWGVAEALAAVAEVDSMFTGEDG